MASNISEPRLRRWTGAGLWPAVVVSLVLGACSGDSTPTQTQVTVSVTVEPGTATITAFGSTVQLTATARGAGGVGDSGKTFAWQSSDATVATVSASGLVTAVDDGSATVSATADGVTGSAIVTVAQIASAIMVTPRTFTMEGLGATVSFSGVVTDANGNRVAGARLTSWASSDTLVATIDNAGLATSVGFGSVTLRAISGTSTGTATLAVTVYSPDYPCDGCR